MYSAFPPRSIAESIERAAIMVFPLAVGTAATRLSPSVAPASTASACGGYNDSIPSSWKCETAPGGSPDSSSKFITRGWVVLRFKVSCRSDWDRRRATHLIVRHFRPAGRQFVCQRTALGDESGDRP